MTTFAYRKVIAAKRPLAVMTTHATKRTSSCVVIQRLRRRYFVCLKSTTHVMTIIATEPFVPIVFAMTETHFESTRALIWACVTTEFMTQAAGRDIAVAGF